MMFTNNQQELISCAWFEPQPKVSFLDKVSVVRSLDSITWSTILQSLVMVRQLSSRKWQNCGTVEPDIMSEMENSSFIWC